jgi:acyl-CoA hydrolase
MEGKKVSESSVTMSQIMQPGDANVAGNVHGGTIMKLIDSAAGVVAVRHCRSNAVTASVDRIDFHHPAYIGDLLIIRSSMNMVGKTSMEIGARVETERVLKGDRYHIASAYLTYVSLDENLHPQPVPQLILETESEKRRNQEAQVRRKMRLDEKKREKAYQNVTIQHLPKPKW